MNEQYICSLVAEVYLHKDWCMLSRAERKIGFELEDSGYLEKRKNDVGFLGWYTTTKAKEIKEVGK